jgi:Tol biopolymer transport system component
MLRLLTVLLVLAPFGVVISDAGESDRPLTESFLVTDDGYALLGPDGAEIDRLDSITNAAGAISPDGHWVAFSRARPISSVAGKRQSELVIQSRGRPQERATVLLVWGTTGSSFLPCWSGDSKRILICEQGHNPDGTRGSAYRVYELATKDLIELKLPEGWWPSDWSADGKHLLMNARRDDGTIGVTRANIDGTGKPEFITSADEVASGARLSPDGRRILCMAGPVAPKDERNRLRLSVIDLSTKRRTVVDEPGETHGYCWSSDGSKIAYTWQRSLERPAEVAVRETLLITCDPDGSNRKTVTSRKYEVPESAGRDGITIFFQVWSWWKAPK